MQAALVSAAVELGDTRTRNPPEANRRVNCVDFPGADDKRLLLAKIGSKAFLEEVRGLGTRFGRIRPRNGCADSHREAYSRRPKFADILTFTSCGLLKKTREGEVEAWAAKA